MISLKLSCFCVFLSLAMAVVNSMPTNSPEQHLNYGAKVCTIIDASKLPPFPEFHLKYQLLNVDAPDFLDHRHPVDRTYWISKIVFPQDAGPNFRVCWRAKPNFSNAGILLSKYVWEKKYVHPFANVRLIITTSKGTIISSSQEFIVNNDLNIEMENKGSGYNGGVSYVEDQGFSVRDGLLEADKLAIRQALESVEATAANNNHQEEQYFEIVGDEQQEFEPEIVENPDQEFEIVENREQEFELVENREQESGPETPQDEEPDVEISDEQERIAKVLTENPEIQSRYLEFLKSKVQIFSDDEACLLESELKNRGFDDSTSMTFATILKPTDDNDLKILGTIEVDPTKDANTLSTTLINFAKANTKSATLAFKQITVPIQAVSERVAHISWLTMKAVKHISKKIAKELLAFGVVCHRAAVRVGDAIGEWANECYTRAILPLSQYMVKVGVEVGRGVKAFVKDPCRVGGECLRKVAGKVKVVAQQVGGYLKILGRLVGEGVVKGGKAVVKGVGYAGKAVFVDIPKAVCHNLPAVARETAVLGMNLGFYTTKLLSHAIVGIPMVATLAVLYIGGFIVVVTTLSPVASARFMMNQWKQKIGEQTGKTGMETYRGGLEVLHTVAEKILLDPWDWYEERNGDMWRVMRRRKNALINHMRGH